MHTHIYIPDKCTLSKLEYNYKNWDMVVYTIHTNYSYIRMHTHELIHYKTFMYNWCINIYYM